MAKASLWALMAKVLLEISKDLNTILEFDGEYIYISGMNVLVAEPEDNNNIINFFIFVEQVYSVESFKDSRSPLHLKFTYYRNENNFLDLCDWLVLFGKEKEMFFHQEMISKNLN